LPLPLVLTVGKKVVRVEEVAVDLPLRSLAEPTAPPGTDLAPVSRFPPLAAPAESGTENHVLVRWLRTTMGVFLSAATSSDFFARAAEALVDTVGLDSGRVLILDHDAWQPQAVHAAARIPPATAWRPSRSVLSKVREEKRTFWEVPGPSPSLEAITAVVAAPILDCHGAVVGVLYGDRRRESSATASVPITELEALLVELLASGVAAGLARLEQEKAALAARVRFEQFFTAELARQLAVQPDLLEGRDCEVTILFCDIRGFSGISERLGPARTLAWMGNVLETLSGCVLAQRGVLVDYIGDELMAMWGAPQAEADHARRACRAALAMLETLPRSNERWHAVLGEPFSLGIGINTGVARVGNTGSQCKFKYGPLGHPVNLASRVQGATKYLKCRLLITGATQAQLDASSATRRLCTVRVVNIAEPLDLHELATWDAPGWPRAKTEYEQALGEFEHQNLRMAARILGNWRLQQPEDGPALLLLARAVNCMVDEPAPFDPVWVLPGK
jgi:adenylate cyclase